MPPLHSIVTYSPFEPIGQSEYKKWIASILERLREAQEEENSLAEEKGRLPRNLTIDTIAGRVRGVVVNKDVDYSIDGLETTLKISPGMLDMTTPITDSDVDSGEEPGTGDGQHYPLEED